ncbi:MAG: BlaI/MecI/CopY family transcriptional regulator [Planctomycetes bacterium]|nr:BlaI/MecI/CopY family transcriptional regulator [Planctomycetota bacterium]
MADKAFRDGTSGEPKGSLTGQQLEIMEAVWAGPPEGLTVADIWQLLAARREVARTTVLTMVTRLAERGWLLRDGEGRSYRYRAACGPEAAKGRLALDFLNEFFDGSAHKLMAALTSTDISDQELAEVRRVLDECEEDA